MDSESRGSAMDISNRLVIESAGSKLFMQLTLFEARVRVSLYTRVSQKNTQKKIKSGTHHVSAWGLVEQIQKDFWFE